MLPTTDEVMLDITIVPQQDAPIRCLKDFLLEPGSNHTFLGHQHCPRIDMKLSSLTHADVGQMHMHCN